MSRPAVFLDRDGTVIHDAGYPRHPWQVRLLPGALAALRALLARGFALVLISNQSGIGRGMITREEMDNVQRRVVEVCAEGSVTFDGWYFCPHAPEEECECRKPSPYMIERACAELSIDATRSFMVGDKLSDVEAGKNAGCRAILLAKTLPDASNTAPDAVFPDLEAAAAWIIAQPPAREGVAHAH